MASRVEHLSIFAWSKDAMTAESRGRDPHGESRRTDRFDNEARWRALVAHAVTSAIGTGGSGVASWTKVAVWHGEFKVGADLASEQR
jgi:hypothetical protein